MEEAQKWADENFKGWGESLTPQEIEGLRTYQNFSRRDINAALRNEIPLRNAEIARAIPNVQSAIEKGELRHDIILYRTIDAPTALKLTRSGEPLTDKAFLSTSLYPGGAIPLRGAKATFVIKAPKGTKAAYPNHVTGKKKFIPQQEVLLQRGTRLKYSAPEPDGKGNYAIRTEIDNGRD